MRIVSKFNDYYDGVQAYAPDASDIVYVRARREYEVGWYASEARRKAGEHELDLMLRRCCYGKPPGVEGLTRGVINFCGKRYPFWQAYDPLAKGKMKYQGFFTYDQLVAYFSRDPRSDVYKRLAGKAKRPRRSRYNWRARQCWDEHLNRTSWLRYQEEFKPEHENDDVFRYFNAPIIVHSDKNPQLVIVNERLNQFTLAKQLDPFTLFQELSMYLGNNLANTENPDDLEMTDVQRAATKGFDKWSFRKKVR
jgi:hypothetical protein